MPAPYSISFTEGNKLIIYDNRQNYDPEVEYPITGLPVSDWKRICWSNNAENTILLFENLRIGLITFVDTSNSKDRFEIRFINDLNENIFEDIVDGNGFDDLESFFSFCEDKLGRPKLSER